MIKKIGVLFVCTGNICRSPSAEGIFAHLIQNEGLDEHFHLDSAGTHGYHVGEAPDPRSQEAALRRGYDLSELRARKVAYEDFELFHYIMAMDRGHHSMMRVNAPREYHSRIQMFLDYAPDFEEQEVPDPYYGGEQGFEHVLDLIEAASRGLLTHIRKEHADRF